MYGNRNRRWWTGGNKKFRFISRFPGLITFIIRAGRIWIWLPANLSAKHSGRKSFSMVIQFVVFWLIIEPIKRLTASMFYGDLMDHLTHCICSVHKTAVNFAYFFRSIAFYQLRNIYRGMWDECTCVGVKCANNAIETGKHLNMLLGIHKALWVFRVFVFYDAEQRAENLHLISKRCACFGKYLCILFSFCDFTNSIKHMYINMQLVAHLAYVLSLCSSTMELVYSS